MKKDDIIQAPAPSNHNSGNEPEQSLITRRAFNKTALLGLAGMMMPRWGAGDTVAGVKENTGGASIRYYFHNFGNLSMIVLERAIQIVIDNIFSRSIVQEAYSIATHYHIKDGHWEACKMNRQSRYSKWDLLGYQLQVLSQQSMLPDLHLHGIVKNNGILGQADAGRVKIIWIDQNWVTIRGSFKVEINRRQFLHSNDPHLWASVIVHEMLHNLGHIHPQNDYGLYLQINAFENAFYYSANSSSYGPLPSARGGY